MLIYLLLQSGLALFFVESFEIYLVLRALLGIASVAVTYSGLILAIEYVDGIWRTVAGMYNLFPLPLSYIMISGIAYLTQDYKYLQLCIGLPGVFLCLLWYVSLFFHFLISLLCIMLINIFVSETFDCNVNHVVNITMKIVTKNEN